MTLLQPLVHNKTFFLSVHLVVSLEMWQEWGSRYVLFGLRAQDQNKPHTGHEMTELDVNMGVSTQRPQHKVYRRQEKASNMH